MPDQKESLDLYRNRMHQLAGLAMNSLTGRTFTEYLVMLGSTPFPWLEA
jgi:hypothetical protein